jgi:superfamily II DNA or RNA helicase
MLYIIWTAKMVVLKFDRGSILIQGQVRTPYGQWDPRIGCFRSIALNYSDITNYLKNSHITFRDLVPNTVPIPKLYSKAKLRPYQKAALQAWLKAGKRGIIVLPTAAGKTFIALKAIEALNVATLVVIPTLDLLDQWRQLLNTQFDVDVGAYGGGEENLEALTVATYDSAYLRAEQLGNKFMLLIFDEVHHLPAPSYSQIAEMYIAPYRMGLTATLEREDGAHKILPHLLGDTVYKLGVDSLAGEHLSPYTHEKILVNLTPQEKNVYNQEYSIFRNYLRRKNIRLRSPKDFRRFIMRTGNDPQARKALLARNRALKIVFNSEAKINKLKEILSINREEKILIFTRYNQLVYKISRQFLIPAITYRTPKQERKEILRKFKNGEYTAVVTSQVLDEGVDVPDASLGFILAGSGSSREYIQRLGRILRKSKGKHAKLIEIVAQKTVETNLSRRRHTKEIQ